MTEEEFSDIKEDIARAKEEFASEQDDWIEKAIVPKIHSLYLRLVNRYQFKHGVEFKQGMGGLFFGEASPAAYRIDRLNWYADCYSEGRYHECSRFNKRFPEFRQIMELMTELKDRFGYEVGDINKQIVAKWQQENFKQSYGTDEIRFWDAKPKYEQTKSLVVSTANIKLQTSLLLTAFANDRIAAEQVESMTAGVIDTTYWPPLDVASYSYGWFVCTVIGNDQLFDKYCPEELAKIIRHAHLVGFNWIQIDRDGPRLDGFPVYDW